MLSTLIKNLALGLLLSASASTWATLIDLGEIGLGSRVETGVITDFDFVGEDWYTEPGSVDEAFFHFDVFDFTVSKKMLLSITVEVDATQSVLYPYIYLFRPGNAPDLLTPISIWTKFDDNTTEIDFYLPDPIGPLLDGGEGSGTTLQERTSLVADPAYRLIVTGFYYEVTDGNFWELPNGTDAGSYSVTFNGVPEPATWLLLGLGLLALAALRKQAGTPAPIPLPPRHRSGVAKPRR